MNVYSPVVECSLSIKIIIRLLFILYETYIFLIDIFACLINQLLREKFKKISPCW